jgi:hypothetical protein
MGVPAGYNSKDRCIGHGFDAEGFLKNSLGAPENRANTQSAMHETAIIMGKGARVVQ